MEVSEKSEILEERINKVLEHIRPYLQIDGGDVELVKTDDKGIVELKLLGACNTCPLRHMTLRAGIERTIMHEIPEVIRIECL
ncbi:MAG TPA: NifU family protein [Ignavibacteria bacterium]|nr:NifU family protein [Ignavibacteria bacterium]